MLTLKPLFGYLAYNRISLKEFSEKSGVNYASLIAMRRDNSFSVKNLDKICTCLNLGIKDIMRFDKE